MKQLPTLSTSSKEKRALHIGRNRFTTGRRDVISGITKCNSLVITTNSNRLLNVAFFVSRNTSSILFALLLNCRGGDFERRKDDNGRENAHT